MPRASREKARCSCQGRYGSSMAKRDVAAASASHASKTDRRAAAAGKVALGDHGGRASGAQGLSAVASSMTMSEALEQSAGGIGRRSPCRRRRAAPVLARQTWPSTAKSDRRSADAAAACAAAAMFSGLTIVSAISAFCQFSVVNSLGRVRLTASAPSAVRTATRRPSSEIDRIRQRAPGDDHQADQRDRQRREAQPGGRQRREHQRDGQHDDRRDRDQPDRVERRQLRKTSSRWRSSPSAPCPSPQKAQPSRPNGISDHRRARRTA